MSDLPRCFGYYTENQILVADINLAYDNVDLIKVLYQRGEELKKGKNVDKLEEKIEQMID